MSEEEHNRRLPENFLQRHLGWCMELRQATLKALTERSGIVAARKSFDYAAKTTVKGWYDARAKLQTFARIHAWAVSGRVGAPKRYQSEGWRITNCLMHGLP